jgi:hypothetical protein
MTRKDAYYFSHDSNAKDDPKCMMLIDQLGLEGYGIFWVLVEILRDQPEYKYPIDLVPIIARRYNTSAEKMKAVVLNFGLFELDEQNNFFSLSLNNRMEHLASIREKRKKAGLISGKVRKQKALNKCSTRVNHKLNKNEQSKGKESKVKESILYYESEIQKNSELEFINQYKAFFDILMFNNPDNDKLEGVLSIPKQVSYDSFCKLLKKSQEKKRKFSALLPSMDNDPKYTKKKSLSLTLHTWLNRDS